MAKLSAGGFLYQQFKTIPPVSPTDLTGKTVVVIGANGGLGFEAAKHFTKMNPGKLILGCRDSEKSRNALKTLKEITGFENVELWTIDLASFDSVKAFADRFENEGNRLDILLESASTHQLSSHQTGDGWESTLQINCLSSALLAILILPIMVKTGRTYSTTPRLSIVSSNLHMASHIDQKLLNSGHFLKTFGSREYCTKEILSQRYSDTKLLEVYFAHSLSSRLGNGLNTPIINTIEPGFCKTGLHRDARSLGFPLWIATIVFRALFAREAEVGARSLIYGATGGANEDPRMRGAFLSGCEVSEVGDNVLSEDGQRAKEAFWGELILILEQVDSRVKVIVEEYLSSLH